MKTKKTSKRSNNRSKGSVNYYIFHGPTDRLSDPYPSAEDAIKAAKSFGSRNSKFTPFGFFSGHVMLASKNGDWRILPEDYIIQVRNVGSRKY